MGTPHPTLKLASTVSVEGSYRSRCTYGCVNQVSCRQGGKQWVGGEGKRQGVRNQS